MDHGPKGSVTPASSLLRYPLEATLPLLEHLLRVDACKVRSNQRLGQFECQLVVTLMGNHHSTRDGIKAMHTVKHAHKLSKHLSKHNPITIKYICRHRKCKRLVDLLVENHPDGMTEFTLGTAKPGGGFTKSHFVTKSAMWTEKSLVIVGATPNGTATLELRYHSRHFLAGKITYEKSGEQQERKEFSIHAHLEESTTSWTCVDKFEDTESGEERQSSSVDSLPERELEKGANQLVV